MFKQVAFGSVVALAFLEASAQMPVPVMDGVQVAQAAPAAQAQAAPDVARQLEALLSCKPGTNFTGKDVAVQFQALGLVQSKGDKTIFLPQGKVVIFDDEIVAASVNDGGQKMIAVYLKNRTGKEMAKKFGVTKINESADTDEPSYIKQISKKVTLLVSSASELFVGNDLTLKYKSAVACQMR